MADTESRCWSLYILRCGDGSTDYSLTELSGKVNGGDGTPQAFALIKLTDPVSSSEI